MKKYTGHIPPCGIFCGSCPKYKIDCEGAEHHCSRENWEMIYTCCVEKKKYKFCYECYDYPCSYFHNFSKSWLTITDSKDNIMDNQVFIKNDGPEYFLKKMNERLK